jgi:hypothetical protein
VRQMNTVTNVPGGEGVSQPEDSSHGPAVGEGTPTFRRDHMLELRLRTRSNRTAFDTLFSHTKSAANQSASTQNRCLLRWCGAPHLQSRESTFSWSDPRGRWAESLPSRSSPSTIGLRVLDQVQEDRRIFIWRYRMIFPTMGIYTLMNNAKRWR